MNIENVTAIELRQAVFTQFEGFRKNLDCEPVTVIDWIGDNINTISDIVTKENSRLIEHGSLNWTFKVRIVEDRPVLVFVTSWTYTYGPGNPTPNVDVLNTLIPNIEIKDITAADDSYGIALEMIFDAQTWSNFIPYATYTNLDFALNAAYGFDQAKKDALTDALTLAKFFYPSVNEEMLALGQNLGMLESLQTFKAWCPTNTLMGDGYVTLPNELDTLTGPNE